MKRPICPLCGAGIPHEEETEMLESGVAVTHRNEQAQLWMHNPRNLHEDILVLAHKDCFNKVKKVYPTFDIPTEKDWLSPVLPFLQADGKMVLKALRPSTLEGG